MRGPQPSTFFLDEYIVENRNRRSLGMAPIRPVVLHNWTIENVPSSHFTIMEDGTIKNNINGDILTKHANSTSAVEHPKHYNMYEGIEIIDLTEQMNNNRGNVVKYVARAEFKGNELQDLEKGLFYLKREIKRMKRKQKKEAKKQIRYVGDTDGLGMPVNRYSGTKG